MAKLDPNGSFDPAFYSSGLGGGYLTNWNSKIYVGAGAIVRRLLPNGQVDPQFIVLNLGRYFLSLQGGDYHVYPDGRVLMSGAHVLSDSVRGFEGLYSLIWFSNTGYLDTTRTHRLCNGVIYAIEEQPDGRFLCTGTMTTYEGQPVNTVFRVEADGTLDTSFEAELQYYGEARDYYTLSDGRILVSGPLKIIGSDEIQGVIRLLNDGSLDPTFNLLDFDNTYSPSQIPSVSCIYEFSADRFIVTGAFDKINGLDRGGIAMIDSSGNLVEDVFDGLGCGAYEFVQSSGSTTYKSIRGIVPSNDGGFFIHGGYHGYDDGTTNDPSQRMVSKLYGLSAAVEERPLATGPTVFPNPATRSFSMQDLPASGISKVYLCDLSGRVLRTWPMLDRSPTALFDVRGIPPGQYVVRMEHDTARSSTKLTVLPE
jgi:uncharacterized delta-60 repeat protein